MDFLLSGFKLNDENPVDLWRVLMCAPKTLSSRESHSFVRRLQKVDNRLGSVESISRQHLGTVLFENSSITWDNTLESLPHKNE